ncbi:MAG: hypothetical protein WA419_10000 [Silvibacterium sp.]
MTNPRLTHAQREGAVIQELQASFPGFAAVPTWTSVPDDPPDFTGASPGGLVGLELVEWLDGGQMGAAQARKAYREKLWNLLGASWATEYQPADLSSVVVCPFWDTELTKVDEPGLRAEFWSFMEEIDRTWQTNPERFGDSLFADHSSRPFLSKYVEMIRLRAGERSWKMHGFSWIDIEEDGGAYEPSDVIRTLEQAIMKKIDLYSNPDSDARLKSKNLDRLELLVHGGFNLYAYNTPRGRLSITEIAAAGAAFYTGLPAARQRFDRIWIFNSLNPAGDWNALVGLPRDFGRLRWLAELWPDYGIDSRSIG